MTTYVNIRARPLIDSVIIGKLYPGDVAPLVSETYGWYGVSLADGSTGYVSRDWTAVVVTAPPPEPELRVYPSSAPPRPENDNRDRGVLNEASGLLDAGRADAAYRLLQRQENEWAGDAGFDYLFGIAALDSGAAGDAVFALERVVRDLPEFVGARMELARALYATGDHARARTEFRALLDKQPPDDVRAVILSYLEIIERPPVADGRSEDAFYAAASAGYDSNANGGAEVSEFMGFNLDSQSVETDSTFLEARIGGKVLRPLRPGVAFQWQGLASHRHNLDADFVDRSFVSTNAAWAFRRGANDFLAGAGGYWSNLDGPSNEYGVALDLGWLRTLKNDNAVQLGLRAGPVRFDSAQNVRDIDRIMYALTYRQPLQGGEGELSWSAIGGRDRAHDRSAPYSNSRRGLRVSGRWDVRDNEVAMSLGYLNIPYNGNRNFFGIDREDDQFVASLSWRGAARGRTWQITPRVRYVMNDSNVAIYDYDRFELGIEVQGVQR